jgi:C-terminal processing protease CtpA/Prc
VLCSVADQVKLDMLSQSPGSVVFLISPRTYSAGEDMVLVFTQSHRGKTIGEATVGSSDQPLMFNPGLDPSGFGTQISLS